MIRTRITFLGPLFAATFAWAGDIDVLPRTVAVTPWPEQYGSQRAIVRVEQSAPVVTADLPWRRLDAQPERKEIIVWDLTTQQRISNVVRMVIAQESGRIRFAPVTVPGEYAVYYLPYTPKRGWGTFDREYVSPTDTASPLWAAEARTATAAPPARVVRFESRTAFDAMDPMGIPATAAETHAFLALQSGPLLVFPEDRSRPIRMADRLPVCWVNRGPSNQFHGEARPYEYYAFQIGLYARETLTNLHVSFSGPLATRLTCFNTGGTNWDGTRLTRRVDVPADRIQPLWFGVDLAADARGEQRADIVIASAGHTRATVHVTIAVSGAPMQDRGDGEPWRHSRLRWLNSSCGSEDQPVAPYPPITGEGRVLQVLGRTVTLDDHGLPAQITAGCPLLEEPVRFVVVTSNGAAPFVSTRPTPTLTPGHAEWTTRGMAGPLHAALDARMDFDGHSLYRLTLTATNNVDLADAALQIRFKPESVPLFMGIGQRGGNRPAKVTWNWKGPYDSFWIGNVDAGLQVELRGATYNGPMLNLYHPAPPTSWGNGGKGSVSVEQKGTAVVAQAASGPRHLQAGESTTFEWALLPTPVKPLNSGEHFRDRYFHGWYGVIPEANVVNIHHATPPNPFINYPFLAESDFRAVAEPLQAKHLKVKIYYTVRELTTRLPELWALRSLGTEVLAGGRGGGHPWLRENLRSNYTPQWYTSVEKSDLYDAAILTSGASRWYNYYVEGAAWMARHFPIDGLYLDDVSYDRNVLRRLRSVLLRERPGSLIDLHSNTGFSIGPANQYAEFFPYVDRLWFGESFRYNEMTPDQWLVEASGIPFGLMADMLQDGGNRWLGLLYGSTVRMPHNAPDLRALWKLWDEFGIADSSMLGYWRDDAPIRTDVPDVLATTYLRQGRALAALGNFATESREVHLVMDARRLGFTPRRITAKGVRDFQPAAEYPPGTPIRLGGKKGVLLWIE